MTPLTLSLTGSGLDAAASPTGAARERNAGLSVGTSAGPSAFARELRQQQNSADQPPQRSEHNQPKATHEPAPAKATDSVAQRQRAADARARGKANAAGERPHAPKAASQATGNAPDAAGQAEAKAKTVTDKDTAEADARPAAPPPAVLNPATGLAGAAPCAPAGGAALALAGTAADALSAKETTDAAPLDATAPPAPTGARATPGPAGAGQPEAARQAEAGTSDAAAAGATEGDAAASTNTPTAASTTPAFADVLAAAGGAAEAGTPAHAAAAADDHPPAAPALAGEIAAEVGSPGFAPALGARLTLLARDGVQEARLALHPADMGPITVQIVVDGSAAHIHFLAEQAATRSAIESSLPTLAAALREGGLTLAGGGVLQQGAGGQGRNNNSDNSDSNGRNNARGQPGRGGVGDAETGLGVQEVAARRPGTPRGVVDLYA